MDTLVGILMDSIGFIECLLFTSEEFGRKNVIRVFLIKNYVCQIQGFREWKRGRWHSEWEKMRQKLT